MQRKHVGKARGTCRDTGLAPAGVEGRSAPTKILSVPRTLGYFVSYCMKIDRGSYLYHDKLFLLVILMMLNRSRAAILGRSFEISESIGF